MYSLDDIWGPWDPVTPEGPLIYEDGGAFDEGDPVLREKVGKALSKMNLTEQEKLHYLKTGEIYDNAEGTRRALIDN